MRPSRIAAAAVLSIVLIGGVTPARIAFAQADVRASEDNYAPLGEQDLEQLAAPIALYPDAVLAQILVASSYPDDVVAAAQWLDAGNDPNAIDDQDWDLSVKGVARYPDLLHYMASHADWMNDLGDAFINQQPDVMDAIQALRSDAMTAGNLVSNDQQQVVVVGSTIEIIPADPQVIYEPIYDPQVAYVRPDYVAGTVIEPCIRFGVGVRVGVWLHHDVDWYDRTIYVGAWGVDRPWWHRPQDHGPWDYGHDRPGLHRWPGDIVVNVHNRPTNIPAGAWDRRMHDPHKALPRIVPHPEGRLPEFRRGSGYPDRRVPTPPHREPTPDPGPLHYDRGTVAARDHDRGAASRDHAAAQPAPQRHAPEPAPARASPPPPQPKPAPREPSPREPSPRGGAASGYENGSQTHASSSRGSASRGAASGGKGH